jgi:glucosamine--fructose-6-phosphate aminotransferase (isomerizing)
MCGIVGVIGTQPAAELLLDGLSRLAYRGYDSAGIATLVDGAITRRRAEGKLTNLIAALRAGPLPGTTGIGHTRWATHGAPTEANAHPHGTARVAVVHNGIIENHLMLRTELEAAGQIFASDTDTETVAQLLDYHLARGLAPLQAAAATFRRLEGAYALALIFADHPELIIGARRGAPLAVGYGDAEMYLGSDALALAPLTRRIAYLQDGDWVALSRTDATFYDAADQPVSRKIEITRLTGAAIGKGNFRHFMEKEICESPVVIGDTLHRMIDPATRMPVLPALDLDLRAIRRMVISACGSAFYAGLVGRYWLEEYARLPTDADVASEFRYRNPPLEPATLGLVVSQSGETADTLAALRYMRQQNCQTLAVVNAIESTIARESSFALETIAGPEISVASTKAVIAQMTVLAGFTLALARARATLDDATIAHLVEALMEVPAKAAQLIADDTDIRALAAAITDSRDILFFGRGSMMPIALEGALKLKELSYIHAEGYPAGEMKHGPIALIDPSVPIIAVIPSGPLFEKTASNLQEAAARGGRIIVLSDVTGAAQLASIASHSILLPTCDPFVAPILYALQVQMLAYHVAILKGTDVDQPRNLAKSVTVE